MLKQQNELSHISGRKVAALSFDQFDRFEELKKLGINLNPALIQKMADAVGMDADITAPLTSSSVTTPIQFLQQWLTGFVHVITSARRIDELVGVTTQGSWEDEEVVQGILELTGKARLYADQTNVPLTNWNVNYERRTVVRFEEGLIVGRLEEARSARINLSSSASKRTAAGESLEINRNLIGFFGFNGGDNRTYGFLNDPSLPAYVSVSDPGSGTEWANKTFLEMCADIRSWMVALRTQSQDRIDPSRDAITLAVATAVIDELSTTSDFGISVKDWLKENYPNVRVISAPELTEANGAENVAYAYADEVGGDGSTDDKRTWVQVVPSKFLTLGVEQRSKQYIEDYSNATAGVMLKRPYAVYRATGI